MGAVHQYDPDKLYVSGANNFQWVPDVLTEEDVFVGVRLSGERLIRGSYAMCDAPQGIVQTTAPESVCNYDSMIAPDLSKILPVPLCTTMTVPIIPMAPPIRNALHMCCVIL